LLSIGGCRIAEPGCGSVVTFSVVGVPPGGGADATIGAADAESLPFGCLLSG
jgi:hypothetical protein